MNFLIKYYYHSFIQGNDQELGGDGEDAGDEEESCHKCMVKGMEIEELKKRNAKQQGKVSKWYENEAADLPEKTT